MEKSPVDMATSAANLRKRRGVVRASTTWLGTRLKELEETSDQPQTHATISRWRLQEASFRTNWPKEQTILDKHDDNIATLSIRLQTPLTPTKTVVAPTSDNRKILSRKLTHLETGLSRINDTLSTAPIEPSLLKQCQEQLSDYKRDLSVLYDDLLAMDVSDAVHFALQTGKAAVWHISGEIKKPLSASPTESRPDSTGVKLPKLDVLTFDGNIIHWRISLTFGVKLLRPLAQRKPREYPGMISTSGNHKARWSPLTLLVPAPPTAIAWSVTLTNILCMLAPNSSHYPMKTRSQSWRATGCAWIVSAVDTSNSSANRVTSASSHTIHFSISKQTSNPPKTNGSRPPLQYRRMLQWSCSPTPCSWHAEC